MIAEYAIAPSQYDCMDVMGGTPLGGAPSRCGVPLRRSGPTLRCDAAFRSDVSAQTEKAGEKCGLDAGFGGRQVNHDHATMFAIRAVLSAILHPHQVTRPINRAIIVG